jgi:hypothetical protein
MIYERSTQDAYGDPGRPVMRRMKDGRSLVRMKDGRMYRAGQGSSPKGDRPFLDLWNPADNKAERIWQAAEGRYETFNGFLDAAGAELLVRTEAPTEPPQDRRDHGCDRREDGS